MKKLILLICVTIVLSGGSLCFAMEAMDIQVSTGLNYDYWENDDRDKGSQFHVPVEIGGSYNALSFEAISAYAQTTINPDEGDNETVSGFVDTKLGISYNLSERLPFDMLVGIDFNLPTGQTGLEEEKLILIRDPDLITITSLGEGFNVTPTLTIGKKWNKLAGGIGIGYSFRGEYDYSKNVKDYDPGDVITTALEMEYEIASSWKASLFGESAFFGENTADGDKVSQDGNYHLVGLGIHHLQSSWNAALTGQSIFRGKSKFKEGTSGLSTESRNSLGNEYLLQLSGNYMIGEKNTISSYLQGIWVEENGYKKDSPFYIGKRVKYTLGIGYQRTLLPTLEGQLKLKGFTMNTEETQWSDEDQTYQGFSAGLFIVKSF